LSRKYNIPWIADYRDAWTQNKYNSRNSLIRNLNSFFERYYLRNTLFIITVSKFLEFKIRELIKEKEFFILPNGYDPQSTHENLVGGSDFRVLRISYVGTLYKWHPIDSFLSIFSKWYNKEGKKNVELNFYGLNIKEELETKISKNYKDIMHCVNFYNKIQNDRLLSELANNDILLLFNDYSIMGTKIYDYLAARKNILLCYSDDFAANKLKEKHYSIDDHDFENQQLQQKLIMETKSGIIVKDENNLMEILENLYLEFIRNGKLKCNTINIEKYSREFQTKLLAEKIKEMIK
jgi:hypothetical protein